MGIGGELRHRRPGHLRHGANNYEYDQVGNLTKDIQEDINTIDWTVYGKIRSISRVGTVKPNLEFVYDATGNRISKKAYISGQPANEDIYTYYVRDAQGNVMATYDYKKDPLGGSMSPLLFSIREHPVYGSSRLGLRNYEDLDNIGAGSAYDTYAGGGNSYAMALKSGNVSYELNNHLGNVLSVISDRKLPVEDVANPGQVDHYEADLLSATDYYPFGQAMPGRQFNNGSYRYGFNGKENDNEVKGNGNQQDYGMRIYDPRVSRFLSVDLITSYYPMLTPYQFSSNTPIQAIDLDGLEALKIVEVIYNDDNTATIKVISDNEVWNNYSSKFQLKLPDNSVHKDWTIEGLKDQLASLKRENGGYTLNGKVIDSHRATTVEKTNPDGSFGGVGRQMSDFLLRITVPMNKLGYTEVSKKAYQLIQTSPLEDLTSEGLDKLIGSAGGKAIKYNRLDVYVPDEKRETFLNIAKGAGIDTKNINFVEQVTKGTTYEILPVKIEAKKLEETK